MRLPYTPVEFTKDGLPADPSQIDAAIAMIGTGTDVLMLAHGWNNDMPGAERMFTRLADNVDTLMAGRIGTGRTLTVVGLLWPSLQWGSDDADTAGHGLADSTPALDLTARIVATVEDRRAATRLARLAHDLEDSAEARAEFLTVLRGQLPRPASVEDDDSPPDTLLDGAPDAVFEAAAQAAPDVAGQQAAQPTELGLLGTGGNSPFATLPDPLAGAGVVGAGFLDFLQDKMTRAAGLLLNTTTFYVMKERAGNVGARGVGALLTAVQAAHPGVRVHLAGHSFGARVVAMAAAVADTPIGSVSLLQGAFSHRGFAAQNEHPKMPDGAFRRALTGGHVRGPIIVTHTHNDKAVLLAYAVASRLANQVAAQLGDSDDPYGGLGANGAVGTAEAVQGSLGDERSIYAFRGGAVHNLRADRFVANHSDVTNLAVANAVLAALTT